MDFDPYETWLGIPADRRPPTHYDLLGLSPDESDPATIDQAALRRMSKVRQHQIGPHSDQSQEILSELARVPPDPDGPGPPGRVRRQAPIAGRRPPRSTPPRRCSRTRCTRPAPRGDPVQPDPVDHPRKPMTQGPISARA